MTNNVLSFGKGLPILLKAIAMIVPKSGLNSHSLFQLVCTIYPLFDDGPKIETQRAKSKPATGSKTKSDKKLSAVPLTNHHHETVQPKPKAVDYDVTKDEIISLSERLKGQTMMKQRDMDELIRYSSTCRIVIRIYCFAFSLDIVYRLWFRQRSTQGNTTT